MTAGAEPEAHDVPGRFVTSRRLTSVAIAYLILLASFAVGLWALEKRDIERTDEAGIAMCMRLQHLRDGINDNSLILAVSLQTTIHRERKLARSGRPQADIHRQSVDDLRALQRYYLYRPPTNCRAAIYDPDGYAPPPPRPFTRAQLRTVHLPRR